MKRWSELRDTERTLAKWARRGPADYLPEPDLDPNLPTKPWGEMNDIEQVRAELSGYNSIGDRWRRRPEPPARDLGRETPSIDLPGL